jgi:hypothetical protein
MKTLKVILVLMLSTSFIACDTNLNDILSAEDLAALNAMETAFNGAEMYNDSLKSYVDNTGITNDATCEYYDSMYHKYDSLFEVNHKMYSHQNNGDDHGSNDWGMGSGWMNGMGNMNGGSHGSNSHGFNTSNCTADNLELMDELMESHDPYHPEG